MELYFEPLECSLATRISLYEAGATATFHRVNLRSKRIEDSSNFRAINAMGQIHVLRTDDGRFITEKVAVLLYVADAHPESGVARRIGPERLGAA
jgi:glutathione S-transferase